MNFSSGTNRAGEKGWREREREREKRERERERAGKNSTFQTVFGFACLLFVLLELLNVSFHFLVLVGKFGIFTEQEKE